MMIYEVSDCTRSKLSSSRLELLKMETCAHPASWLKPLKAKMQGYVPGLVGGSLQDDDINFRIFKPWKKRHLMAAFVLWSTDSAKQYDIFNVSGWLPCQSKVQEAHFKQVDTAIALFIPQALDAAARWKGRRIL